MSAPELVRAAQTAASAGERLARAIAAADARRGACRLAISGGSALAALPYALKDMPEGTWSRVQLTWADERCVALADPASNRGAYKALGLPPLALELPLWEDGDDPESALRRVSRALADALGGGLDVVLLGLGEDGHVASLFPGHPACAASAAVVHVDDSPKPPPRRMTLGLPLLRATPRAIMLAAGEGKRAALRRLLARDPALPASALPDLTIVTDLDRLDRHEGETEA